MIDQLYENVGSWSWNGWQGWAKLAYMYQTSRPKIFLFSFFFFLFFTERTLANTDHITSSRFQTSFNKLHPLYHFNITNMAIFGFRRLLKNLFCFGTTGLNEERAPPPTPVPEERCRRLRSSRWDVEGVAACAQLSPCGKPHGMVVRTRSEAAAGVCNIIYPQ